MVRLAPPPRRSRAARCVLLLSTPIHPSTTDRAPPVLVSDCFVCALAWGWLEPEPPDRQEPPFRTLRRSGLQVIAANVRA
jgi:hypothetical protein